MRTALAPLAAACCCALALMPSAARGAVLYDVSFSTPLHTVGSPPPTGGMNAPSSITAQPTVQASFGATASQSVELRPPIRGDLANSREGIVFDVTTDAPRFLVDADVWVETLPEGVFEVVTLFAQMDSHEFHENAFWFRGGQSLGYFSQDSDHAFGGDVAQAGSWPLRQVMHLAADIDVANDSWTIRLDGSVVHSGEFARDPGARITSFQFELNDSSGNGDSASRIDNILISAVPEPAATTVGAVAAGLAVMRTRRRNR